MYIKVAIPANRSRGAVAICTDSESHPDVNSGMALSSPSCAKSRQKLRITCFTAILNGLVKQRSVDLAYFSPRAWPGRIEGRQLYIKLLR